jgi:predicted acylesterase/phospholipase RssA
MLFYSLFFTMFQRIKNLFPASSSRKKNSSPAEKSAFSTRYVLVLSGGGTRGFYTLGVLKALEES